MELSREAKVQILYAIGLKFMDRRWVANFNPYDGAIYEDDTEYALVGRGYRTEFSTNTQLIVDEAWEFWGPYFFVIPASAEDHRLAGTADKERYITRFGPKENADGTVSFDVVAQYFELPDKQRVKREPEETDEHFINRCARLWSMKQMNMGNENW